MNASTDALSQRVLEVERKLEALDSEGRAAVKRLSREKQQPLAEVLHLETEERGRLQEELNKVMEQLKEREAKEEEGLQRLQGEKEAVSRHLERTRADLESARLDLSLARQQVVDVKTSLSEAFIAKSLGSAELVSTKDQLDTCQRENEDLSKLLK